MSKDEAQRRFLRARAIKERDMEKCCDCPGCDTCKGFVRNCKCDVDMSFLPWKTGLEGVKEREELSRKAKES